MRLLEEPVAVDEKRKVLGPGGGTAREGTLNHRADDVPDLRPVSSVPLLCDVGPLDCASAPEVAPGASTLLHEKG